MQPVNIPFIGISRLYNDHREQFLDAADRVLRSGQLMNGNYTAEFENWLAKKNHSKYAVTVHSGTTALEIQAAYYKEISNSKHPTVALPTVTFPATGNAFVRAGWDVTLLDCDNYGMAVHGEHEKFDIFVMVGIYGHGVDSLYDDIWIGSDNVIEDGAQHWLSRNCRRYGLSTAISFDPSKNLPNFGNGGALVTDDLEFYEFAKRWRNHGKGGGVTQTGSNARMSEVDCAQMLIKAEYIDSWQDRRADIARYWMERLNEAGVRTLIDRKNFDDHCYHKFVIDADNRNELESRLKYRGIETKVHYPTPLHEMTCFANSDKPDMFATASSLSRRVLSLPIYPELTDLEIEYIADQVLDCAFD